MRKFDYSFLNSGLLPANLLNLITDIYAVKAMVTARKEDSDKAFLKLEADARMQSVKYANALAGIVTSDVRLREIVTQNSDCRNCNEAEIAGYRNALQAIQKNYVHMDFSSDELRKLHEILFSFVEGKTDGRYRTQDGVGIGFQPENSRGNRFYLTPVSEAGEAVKQLELAYKEAIGNGETNPLLLIPCVVLDFLCLHPFEYGNVRMSRLLCALLLFQNGFDVGKYAALEEVFSRDKSDYDEAFHQSSIGWESGNNDYFPFVQNFLSALQSCYQKLRESLAGETGRRLTKKERIEQTVLGSSVPISKADICKMLPDVSPTTIEAVLGNMMREQTIRRLGAARNTKYIKSK
ncbi:MAG: Fic family protein [Eubacterium sp.]|nr:Fic family protein [Eubacterium sp.]